MLDSRRNNNSYTREQLLKADVVTHQKLKLLDLILFV